MAARVVHASSGTSEQELDPTVLRPYDVALGVETTAPAVTWILGRASASAIYDDVEVRTRGSFSAARSRWTAAASTSR